MKQRKEYLNRWDFPLIEEYARLVNKLDKDSLVTVCREFDSSFNVIELENKFSDKSENSNE